MLKPDKYDPLKLSVGHILDIIGEGWSMLIVREAFLGTRRFEEFQGRLGIARNILTARLKRLCANEILDRVPVKEGAKRHEYILTNKGKDMLPLLVALSQWGDKWVFGEDNVPVIFLDRDQGEPISGVQVFSTGGKVLQPRDIMVIAGPGATREARERLEELNKNE
ncbi:MAG: helix-turn-helix transcriptional regulator [Gammaproteobacteria bacterium]|nr:helix-turn-helix transcriptional regulator [Gammaproteobacteria bacterium]